MATHLEEVYDGHLLTEHADDEIEPFNTSTVSLSDLRRPSSDEFPITLGAVKSALLRLPTHKAPGADHIRSEMLKPLIDQLSPFLLDLLQLCWLSAYTPKTWRIAQVVPIYKKGPHTDPANFRPISLTSVLRKMFEYCLQEPLKSASPPLDMAQGGFRPARSAMDQAFCLQELCTMHKNEHKTSPILAFLDIKSAYDTVDRRVIWKALRSYAPPSLIALLQNLFNDVSIEVLISNAVSRRFSPATGVLQGSVLSLFLYSIYINGLPKLD